MFKKGDIVVHNKYIDIHKDSYRVISSYDDTTTVDYSKNIEMRFKTSHLRLATTEEIKAGHRL